MLIPSNTIYALYCQLISKFILLVIKLFEKFEKFESSANHEGSRTHSLTEDGPGTRMNQKHSVGGRTVVQRTEDVCYKQTISTSVIT